MPPLVDGQGEFSRDGMFGQEDGELNDHEGHRGTNHENEGLGDGEHAHERSLVVLAPFGELDRRTVCLARRDVRRQAMHVQKARPRRACSHRCAVLAGLRARWGILTLIGTARVTAARSSAICGSTATAYAAMTTKGVDIDPMVGPRNPARTCAARCAALVASESNSLDLGLAATSPWGRPAQ